MEVDERTNESREPPAHPPGHLPRGPRDMPGVFRDSPTCPVLGTPSPETAFSLKKKKKHAYF